MSKLKMVHQATRIVVAIIGLPNVGKSTLFNRIVGERDAIVHSIPGVTRDRHYAEAEWAGKTFALVDTGGFVPDSDDLIERAVREQAEVAIQESDVVLFVVDAQHGLNPVEKTIAGLLRKSEKPVILCVNKVDADTHEVNIHQFHELGLGDPIGISALSGRNVGNLLDLLVSAFPSNGEIANELIKGNQRNDRLRIAIVGRPNVGKSSLANALLGEERIIVTEIPGTTRDAIDSVLRYYGEEIVLIDTAGLRKHARIAESVEFFSALRTLRSLEQCHVAIVVIDATVGLQSQDLKIIEEAIERKRGIILAANKWDLVEKDSTTAQLLEGELRGKLRRYDFIPIVFVSAKTKQRVFRLVDLAKSIKAELQKRIETSTLNNVLLSVVRDHPPPPIGIREVKISFITQAKGDSPVFIFFTNHPDGVSESYARFLENQIRKQFGFLGVPITLRFRKKS